FMYYNSLQLKNHYQEDNRIDLMELLNKILDKWYIFLICACIGVLGAYLYSKTSQEEYQIETTILIHEQEQGYGLQNMFNKSPFNPNHINIANQIGILGSYTLCKQTLENLDWTVYYYRKGFFSTDDLYKSAPFHVTLKESAVNIASLPVYISPLSNTTYHISVNDEVIIDGNENHIEFSDNGTFGQLYENKYFSFIVNKVP